MLSTTRFQQHRPPFSRRYKEIGLAGETHHLFTDPACNRRVGGAAGGVKIDGGVGGGSLGFQNLSCTETTAVPFICGRSVDAAVGSVWRRFDGPSATDLVAASPPARVSLNDDGIYKSMVAASIDGIQGQCIAAVPPPRPTTTTTTAPPQTVPPAPLPPPPRTTEADPTNTTDTLLPTTEPSLPFETDAVLPRPQGQAQVYPNKLPH